MNIPAADNLHLHETADGIAIPLGPNSNDKGCLFAGSIYSGAILAAYRAAERRCVEKGLSGGLVAKSATVRYLKSIVTDGRAVAVACGDPVCKPNGNHSVAVTVAVLDAADTPCAEFSADMVLMKKRADAVDPIAPVGNR